MGELVVRLIHIFIFAPFFLYMGLYVPTTYWWYFVSLLLGIVVIVWWCFLSARSESTVGWFAWHVLIIGGLLIVCGIGRQHSPRIVFSLFLALGFATVGYHTTRWIQGR